MKANLQIHEESNYEFINKQINEWTNTETNQSRKLRINE